MRFPLCSQVSQGPAAKGTAGGTVALLAIQRHNPRLLDFISQKDLCCACHVTVG